MVAILDSLDSTLHAVSLIGTFLPRFERRQAADVVVRHPDSAREATRSSPRNDGDRQRNAFGPICSCRPSKLSIAELRGRGRVREGAVRPGNVQTRDSVRAEEARDSLDGARPVREEKPRPTLAHCVSAVARPSARSLASCVRRIVVCRNSSRSLGAVCERAGSDVGHSRCSPHRPLRALRPCYWRRGRGLRRCRAALRAFLARLLGRGRSGNAVPRFVRRFLCVRKAKLTVGVKQLVVAQRCPHAVPRAGEHRLSLHKTHRPPRGAWDRHASRRDRREDAHTNKDVLVQAVFAPGQHHARHASVYGPF